MSHLRDNPVFHHVHLLERGDALWLLPDDGGRWTLPGFVSDEQHTAEVELVADHMRPRHGVRMAVLGTVAGEFDDAANRVRKAHLAEALSDTPAAAAGGRAPPWPPATPRCARTRSRWWPAG